ncbi:uncharacterized protein E0L32_007118 [Thyridium curvatum]|uniref:AMP-activated protein kinase glycogen-binding domain-containing protein n=1 Tax=Thyridium curvatum TaxID=1093900 RepID=A0A507AQH1_9PEZI|nr:uncharacterized protein E0L32_007118 [Thyridium curvatum]TPX12232.1 hypothetical protein E0L32_007118 [Thyridium curvatum]
MATFTFKWYVSAILPCRIRIGRCLWWLVERETGASRRTQLLLRQSSPPGAPNSTTPLRQAAGIADANGASHHGYKANVVAIEFRYANSRGNVPFSNRPHAAEEVYVTGTFDNWAKTEKLEKKGDHFEKTVTLPDFTDKILYKFVVDGNWTTDHTASQEKDASGIDNNVLTPEDVIKAAPATAAILSSVSPESTTAALAKDVPLEKNETKPAETPSDIPGGFPETPANELDKEVKLINPIPASEGAGNPITLAPGEKVPAVNASDINSHVKLDKESYEKADALPGVMTDLPPVTGNMIPESSLPINGAPDATISSVAPGSTTAALAAKVPLEEPKVPEVVKESQEKAGVDPEASGIAEEVKEKEEVEEELLKKVSKVPSTSEGTAGKGTEKSENDKTLVESVTAAAAGIGAAALATAAVTKDKVVEQASAATQQATTAATEAATQLPDPVKEALPISVQETINNAAKEETRQEVSPEVPAEVKESIQEAGKNPEAAANTAAVEEKKVVEAELLKEVKEVKPAAGGEEKAADKAAPADAAAPATSAATGTTSQATPEAIKDAATPSKAATTVPAADAAGAASKAPASPATTEKKKKNRLSSFFNKLKSKTSSKDKA